MVVQIIAVETHFFASVRAAFTFASRDSQLGAVSATKVSGTADVSLAIVSFAAASTTAGGTVQSYEQPIKSMTAANRMERW